jgi:hypothetical protein|tara:strand:- start:845 stop:1000 length:156 start_codon:yes stop_codon:yes gene_type:complete
MKLKYHEYTVNKVITLLCAPQPKIETGSAAVELNKYEMNNHFGENGNDARV